MAIRKKSPWERRELVLLVVYAIIFYIILIRRSLQLSRDHYQRLYGLRPGWLADWYNDLSDAQWRNFRGNLPLLTLAFGIFTMLAHTSRALFGLKARGTAIILLVLSLAYLSHLHGVCIIFVFSIASANFYIVKIFAKRKYFPLVLWSFNLSVLLCNRVYEGYPFSSFGQNMAYLDNFRGTFRWHICFNFVILRMISFGYDYHWAQQDSCFDQEKHIRRCQICKSGRICYRVLQDRGIKNELFSYSIYLSYLVYAPLYIAGPVLSFNAFAAQLDRPQNSCPKREVAWYGLRWVFNLFLMELMTHLFYYNAFAVSDTWKQLTPMEVFIIGYGVLNFMWLKFLLIWRYFRFWSLINGIEVPENMPKCINNCYNLESFWKNWHASFNKWLVRYLYIPLGGSHRKLLNIWVVFTFVAVWHDLEWKLLSWAWLTCFFFLPEMLVKSAANTFKVKSAIAQFIFRELSAFAGAITITCLMVANLVGYVIGPSGINWLLPQFVEREGLPVLGGMFVTFYAGTKLMFHLQDCEVNERKD